MTFLISGGIVWTKLTIPPAKAALSAAIMLMSRAALGGFKFRIKVFQYDSVTVFVIVRACFVDAQGVLRNKWRQNNFLICASTEHRLNHTSVPYINHMEQCAYCNTVRESNTSWLRFAAVTDKLNLITDYPQRFAVIFSNMRTLSVCQQNTNLIFGLFSIVILLLIQMRQLLHQNIYWKAPYDDQKRGNVNIMLLPDSSTPQFFCNFSSIWFAPRA